MASVLLFATLLLFFKGSDVVSGVTVEELDAYFSNCDAETLKSGMMAWDSILPNGDWIRDRTKQDVLEHCQMRIEGAKKVISEIEECAADEIKDGIPEFTKFYLTLLENLCNNDTVIEQATHGEESGIMEEDLFHDCYEIVNLKVHLMTKYSSDLWKQQLCCLWAENSQCYDQVLNNVNTRSQYFHHFDFYIDKLRAHMCGVEELPLDHVCGSIPPNPASHAELIFYHLMFLQLQMYGI